MVVVSNFIFFLLALGLVLGVVAVLARSMRQGLSQAQGVSGELHAPTHPDGAPGVSSENPHQGSEAPDQPMAQDARQTLLAQAQIFRAQLRELESERDAGLLSEDDFAHAHDELARRLLEDTQGLGVAPAQVAPTAANSAKPASTATVTASLWLQRSLSFWWSVGLTSFLILSSLTLYATLGEPDALMASSAGSADESAMQQGHGASAEDLSAMVNDLNARLKKEPNSADDWLMLARVQRTREHYDEANEAFKRSLALSQNTDVLIERAEVLALKQQGQFEGEPQQIIDTVLKADPDQANALLLALQRWTRVRKGMDNQAPQAQTLDQVIAMAAQRAGLSVPTPPGNPKPTAAGPALASGVSGAISGRVSLTPALLAQVSPTDTVFIYATQTEGPRMPVAIIKTQVSALPMAFELNDSSAMSPERRISLFSTLNVHARISKSGQAMAQPTDLGVTVSPVKLGAKGVELQIQGLYKP